MSSKPVTSSEIIETRIKILQLLKESGNYTKRIEIEEKLKKSKNWIDSMTKKGLIARGNIPGYYKITEKGEKYLETAKKINLQALKQIEKMETEPT